MQCACTIDKVYIDGLIVPAYIIDIVYISVSDPFHFDTDPDQDPAPDPT